MSASTPQPVRGMQSLLGEEAERMAAVVAAFDRVRRLFGFKRVEVPVLEPTAVFARSLGETTDVVSKEMYSFEDKGGDSVTLRPEFTAGIARAFLSEGWQQFILRQPGRFSGDRQVIVQRDPVAFAQFCCRRAIERDQVH